jgi:hypothetical protein
VIRDIPGLPQGIIGFEASGRVGTDDYRRVLDPILESAATSGRTLRLVAVISDDASFDAGALLEDARMGLKTWSAWERIALVSDRSAIRDGVGLLGWAFPSAVKVFPSGELAEAIEWAARG